MKPSTDQDGCGEAKHRDNERKREQKRELVTALCAIWPPPALPRCMASSWSSSRALGEWGHQ